MGLEDKYKTLVCETLPSLAQAKASTQAAWPVQLDHCFARIILDAVVGRGEYFCTSTSTMMSSQGNTPSPWPAKLKSPAIRNMDGSQLAQCIALAEALADGKVDLCEMDEQSLWFRGKSSKRKRPLREDDRVQDAKRLKSDPPPTSSKPLSRSRKTSTQQDIRRAFSTPVVSDSSHPLAATIDEDLRQLIEESEISTFRKRVLTTLCQVPKGHVSTYLALSNHLCSSPRAVGNALRNNPFAPRVPCHRIVAANGGIGGFGGEWGLKGKHSSKKVKILCEEGVKIDKRKGVIMDALWAGFL